MDIIVQKFGGTSVANIDMLNKVCSHIIREHDKGKKVVVVVSAQGKTTDKLVKEQEEITKKPKGREKDVLLSVGEQITIAKLCMCLHEKGYEAISFTGWQVPIKTDNIHTDANILDIAKENIIKELEQGKIVVVAGFQGVNSNNEITTLGRGGSDTTAVQLAVTLDAKICEIYTDVDGVYKEDPNVNKNAEKIKNISYDEMLKMCNQGAKVLHYKCVEIAKKHNMLIDVKSTLKNGEIGTLVQKF